MKIILRFVSKLVFSSVICNDPVGPPRSLCSLDSAQTGCPTGFKIWYPAL